MWLVSDNAKVRLIPTVYILNSYFVENFERCGQVVEILPRFMFHFSLWRVAAEDAFFCKSIFLIAILSCFLLQQIPFFYQTSWTIPFSYIAICTNRRTENIYFAKLMQIGVIHKPCSHQGGRGGRKSPKIGYVIGVKLSTLGGGGSKITQKMATWFMNDP